MALQKKRVPVFGVGIDTKSDPKLMPAGELVELENMWQKRTGELVQRNGFTSLAAGNYPITGIPSDLFPGLSGGLMANVKTWNGQVPPNVLAKYAATGTPWANGWIPATGGAGASAFTNDAASYPRMTAAVTGWMSGTNQVNAQDIYDPDIGYASGGIEIMSATSAAGATVAGNLPFYETRDPVTGTVMDLAQINYGGTFVRPPVLVSGSITAARTGLPITASSPYVCRVRLDTNAAPYSLFVDTLYNGRALTSTKVVNADVSAAQPWFDAMHVVSTSGTYTPFVIAYRATGGGVTLLTVSPATGAIDAGPLNTPGLTASMCLGFLVDDLWSQGDAYLATADAANGVRYTRIAVSSGSVSIVGTATIDAAATANVRQITGYVVTANSVVVLWDTDATPAYNQQIHVGTWNGAATSQLLVNTFGLFSRAFTAPDGQRYVVASYDSTAYPIYAVLNAGVPLAAQQPEVAGMIYPGYAGGRRTVTGSLASAVYVNGSIHVPLTKRQSFTTGSGVLVNQRSIGVAALSWSAPLRRPRELGGTLFMPGGLVMKDDGALSTWAAVPIPPESPTLTQSAGGGLTALATYFYRGVVKQTDATGRVTRSAGSVPVSITLAGGNQTVTATFTVPGLQYLGCPSATLELYRAGPAAAGAVNYNRVAEFPIQASAGSVGIGDTVTDIVAAAGEFIYSTGNVLENSEPPSCNLMEVNGGRLWLVNAEDPTELWFSKTYTAGVGIGFSSVNTLRIQGDNGGAITALSSMDGRLIVFKRAVIQVISGAGPNDLGQGSFNPPQAASTAIGTAVPGSVVATPDGVMFQSAKGIYLLDRGLGLTYIGSPVEQYTLAANVVDSSLVDGYTQVRFVFSDGRVLVYDYFQKRWYTWLLPVGGSTVVACANSSTVGWCYATLAGVVRQEVNAATTDDGASIIPRIRYPDLSLAGLNGYQRFYGMDIQGEFVGNHTLSVQFEYDGSGVLSTPQTKAITAGTYQYEVNPGPVGGASGQRCSRVKPTLTLTGTSTAGGFKITGIGVTVGVKKGNNIPYTSRLT